MKRVRLTSLVEVTEDVVVGKQTITVHAVPFEDIARLMWQFPSVISFLDSEDKKTPELAASMMKEAPVAVAVMAAYSTEPIAMEHRTDEKKMGLLHKQRIESAEAFRTLGIAVQLRLLRAVIHCTFDEGFGPFVAMVKETSEMMKQGMPEATVAAKTEAEPSPSTKRTEKLLAERPVLDFPPKRRSAARHVN